MRIGPRSASPDAWRIVSTRALRGFADGVVSVLLVAHLSSLGYSPFQIGVVVTGTLVGSAALTLAVGLAAHRYAARAVLLSACVLMAITGIGFAAATAFWVVLSVAVIGTMNPSAGDVSVFLPTEQALLADQVDPPERTHLYAIYNLGGSFAGALGALASGVPDLLGITRRAGFLVTAAVAAVMAMVYRTLPRTTVDDSQVRTALGPSRVTVLKLAALFSLDSAGSGFAVQSILVLWLHLRFDLSVATTGAVFFGVGLLTALSQLAAAPLARRIGLVPTMVGTHLPASLLLIVAAFAPTAPVAVGLLFARALLSQMDVPARQALVMAVVTPAERAAAASVTNVPRSLASATTPALAGLLLSQSHVGWPLVIAGVTKATYDLLLLAMSRRLAPVN
ncbi:MAG: MFS transporter [Acidimicrobiales bacterium]